MSYFDDQQASIARRNVLLLAGGIVAAVVLGGLVVLLLVRGGNDAAAVDHANGPVPDVAAPARNEAIARLTSDLAPQVARPIVVTVGDERATVVPASAGLSVDVPATVDQALRGGAAPEQIGGQSSPPVIRVDDVKLAGAVAKLARTFDQKLVQGTVTFDGVRPVARKPKTGVKLDREGAADALRAAFLTATAPVALPAAEEKPKVTAAEVKRALADVARPAVAAGLVLADAERKARVAPAQLARHLSFTTNGDRLELTVDGAGLAAIVEDRLRTPQQRPVDATFRIVQNRPQLVPGRVGKKIDSAALARTVAGMLPRSGDRTVQVLRVDDNPDLTTEEAQKLGIKERLSTYTQPFGNSSYRIHNIGLAASRINGTLLKPGDVYSQNRTLRERSEANGYVQGYIIKDGRYIYDLGGGVSTATTTMWDAAFFAGLERIEQRGHTLYIPNYRAGLEATVVYGKLDLRFRNDSPTGVLITASISRGRQPSITVSMWGTKHYDVTAEPYPVRTLPAEKVPGRYNIRKFTTVYDTEKRKPEERPCEPHEGADGFDIDITRVFRPVGGGQVIKREKLTTSYAATKEVVCGPKPKAGEAD